MTDIATFFNSLADEIHADVRRNGFWNTVHSVEQIADAAVATIRDDQLHLPKAEVRRLLVEAAALARDTAPHNDSEKLMLVVTELAEVCEGLRHGNPKSDKIPEFNAAEEEYADAIIRILDHCAARNWRVGDAIVAKLAFNRGRPFKHNKAF